MKWPWSSEDEYPYITMRGITPNDALGRVSQNMEEKTKQMNVLAGEISRIWESVYKRNLQLANENKALKEQLKGAK